VRGAAGCDLIGQRCGDACLAVNVSKSLRSIFSVESFTHSGSILPVLDLNTTSLFKGYCVYIQKQLSFLQINS